MVAMVNFCCWSVVSIFIFALNVLLLALVHHLFVMMLVIIELHVFDLILRYNFPADLLLLAFIVYFIGIDIKG